MVSDYYHDDPVDEPAVRRILPKFIAGSLLMLFSFVYYQTTLAANININSSRSIEFGQGVSVTAPCAGSDNLTVTPKSSFVNAANGTGAHYLNSVKVAGIPASCNGKDFSLSFYDSVTGSSALPIFSFFGENQRVATVYNSAGYFLNGFQSAGTEVSSASGAFTVTFTTPVALSTNAMKVTLQTNEHKDWAEASVSSRVAHTCAVLSTGAVKCWGLGGRTQLGNGQGFDSDVPVNVPSLSSGVIEIGTGAEHSCALLATGEMKCWGRNAAGQLGDNTVNDKTDPVNVINLSAVRAMSVGYTHTCAVTRTGAAKCWGQGAEFQLGHNSNGSSNQPTDVSNLSSGVIAIAAGEQHTCAVLDTGAAQCWGWNRRGELGIGNFDQQKKIPVPVVGLNARAIAVAAGQQHTCVLLITGGVQCMGDNLKGQIGNDSTTANFHSPQNVRDITNAVAISAGQNHSCALLSTGAVQCWGANGSGQVGITTAVTQRHYPETVQSLGGIATAITTGSTHSCAVLITRAAKCWGSGANGRLGNGSLSDSSSPVSVTGIP